MIGRWEVPQWSRRLCLRGHCRRAAGVVAVGSGWDDEGGLCRRRRLLWGAGEGSQ